MRLRALGHRAGVDWVGILNRMIKIGVLEKVTFKQRLERGLERFFCISGVYQEETVSINALR